MNVSSCTLRTSWLRAISPVVVLGSIGRSRSFSATSQPDGKIYELRRYKVKPDRYTELVRLGTEKYEDVMMQHGKLLGYWSTELGAVREVSHLWEYDSYTHREEVVKAKQNDKRVQEEYLKFALPCLHSQDHIIMKAFPWYTPQLTPQTWGVYELVIHRLKPLMMPQLEHRLLQGLPARLAEDYPKPLGIWYSVFGDINLSVSLWPHESFDKRDEHRAKLMKDNIEWIDTSRDTAKYMDEMVVRGLVPLPWSPLK